ncbi:hypothetical protein TSIB_1947 [Thermococcus sibiricus MM 739]|uniref:Uncharacterized protein n=1 Tax=Thermococcus sibiricus (strain DSM 12597 / MM 739) TaxID=604354 RepID=C6A015_THESM|nr:hypothetical protein TSIB_1947 [Thermococcus sibiricus MM 739]
MPSLNRWACGFAFDYAQISQYDEIFMTLVVNLRGVKNERKYGEQ